MAIEVRLLGHFEVRRDGAPVPAFPRRDAAALVKVLALAPGHRLSCERVADALWPGLLLDEARPRLHKAAHFARRGPGAPDAVVLRDDAVALFPGAGIAVDVERFEHSAAAALTDGDPAACAAAAALCPGDLLPGEEFEQWTQEPRDRVRRHRLAVLRAAGRWDDVLELEPADEQAHLALLRAAVAAGDRTGALRRYDRMAQVLAAELGVQPGEEARALRERVLGARQDPAPPTTRLLERGEELRRLTDVVDGTLRSGRGVVVLVGGEAGSGKTALLAALLDRVRDRIGVLRGGCDDLLAPRSLGPFRDVAHAAPGGALAAALAAGGSADTVFPALLDLVGERPTLLALEDVHWADDATVDAVRFLARRVDELPLVLLLSCREDELGRTHPLRRVLGSVPGAALQRVPVRPLSVRAVAALSDGRADPERLHRVTRGNAFYVTEVLAAGGSGVPATVRDAVLARLAALSADAQDLVARLAVVPSRVSRTLAEQLAAGRLDPMVEAERAGVLGGDAGAVWFRHEIARAAVLSTLTPAELVAAHRTVLDALLAEPSPDPARVVHHASAGRRADVLLEYGPLAAGDAVRAGAYRQAAETLRLTIPVSGGRPPALQARLLADHAASLYYLNRFEEAFGSAGRAVGLAEGAGDDSLLADALIVLSKAAFWARGPLRARDAATRAVGLLAESGDDVRRASALACLARSHSNLGTLGIVAEPGAVCLGYAEQALELAEKAGSDEIRCQALFYVGSGRLADGDERGAADLEESIAVASGDPHLELRLRACVNAAGSAYRFGRFSDADRYVDLGLRLAEQCEFFAGEYKLKLTRAALRASEGRWDDAVGELRALLAAPGDPAAMGLQARSLLARLLARRGAHAEAAVVLAPALETPEARAEIFVAGPVAAAAVELAWLSGDDDAAPGLAEAALRRAAEVGHRGSRSELLRYLQRAGHDVAAPADALGPWAPALAGRPLESAAAWTALGERYEAAVERALSGAERDRGRTALAEMGAIGTLSRL
ncbi:ATP-binding protein [Petropleomorpha daqingensis]|uniref:DNA-binding SARP family transcriptional activator n=1 Tax=Petropleomorpha daqingensis TaxID=2026353 RepID=A0A853CQ61_9ACTN|nr:DNA-binding SARP family transcriptional activator [Petropleomorpha daqingensis]